MTVAEGKYNYETYGYDYYWEVKSFTEMTLQELHSALRIICNDALSALSINTQYDADPTRVSDSGLYARVHISTQDSKQTGLGISQYRWNGDIVLMFFDDLESGDKEILTNAGTVLSAMREASHESIIFLSPQIDIIGVVKSKYQVNITIPFRSEHYV